MLTNSKASEYPIAVILLTSPPFCYTPVKALLKKEGGKKAIEPIWDPEALWEIKTELYILLYHQPAANFIYVCVYVFMSKLVGLEVSCIFSQV